MIQYKATHITSPANTVISYQDAMGNTQHKDDAQDSKKEHGFEVEAEKQSKRNAIIVFYEEKGIKICQILFVILAVVLMLVAIGVIAAAVTTSIATKLYHEEQSGRLVALIVLAVTAAVAITTAIGASTSMFKGKKHLSAISSIFLVIAIIQAVICGVSVRVTDEDQLSYTKSLMRSFRQAQIEGSKFGKLWDTTQTDLKCCGVYSSEDYRDPRLPFYFAPDVPIACCRSYDRSRSNLVQEREREVCRAQKSFYTGGCKEKMVEVLVVSANVVIAVTALLIVLELALMIWGMVMASKTQKDENRSSGTESNNNKKKPEI